MRKLAIIGGTGLERANFGKIIERYDIDTPFGQPSSPIIEAEIKEQKIFFLSRHGENHTIAPHMINYRANIWALESVGVKKIIAVAAVGGISSNIPPTALMLPDQIIDYTWGRDHTFYDSDKLEHIEFTTPYCEDLRQDILKAAAKGKINIEATGTYGATQGPRLETAAEINRLTKDGCDIVGMTGMPEAALARELGLCYATIAISANWAAGLGVGAINMAEIKRNLEIGMSRLIDLLNLLTTQNA